MVSLGTNYVIQVTECRLLKGWLGFSIASNLVYVHMQMPRRTDVQDWKSPILGIYGRQDEESTPRRSLSCPSKMLRRQRQ